MKRALWIKYIRQLRNDTAVLVRTHLRAAITCAAIYRCLQNSIHPLSIEEGCVQSTAQFHVTLQCIELFFAGELAQPALVTSSSSSWSIWDSGEWWMLLAAQSMAVGTVMVRYVTKYADPIMATGYHMLLGGIPLLLLSAQQESSELAERLPLLTGDMSLP